MLRWVISRSQCGAVTAGGVAVAAAEQLVGDARFETINGVEDNCTCTRANLRSW